MNIASGKQDNEGEDVAGWSDEHYKEDIDEPAMKKQSSVNYQIERYSMNLGNKESIKILSQ